MDGKLHIYHPKRRLNLLEYSAPHKTPPNNVLLFVGGMFDNFRSVSYVDELAEALHHSPWRVCHVQLSSATRNFGTFNLDRDVDEIETCIKFIRSNIGNTNTRIVLLGHSTGCQDTFTYVYAASKSPRPPIQGAILQAAVSDREGALHTFTTQPNVKTLYDQCMALISSTPSEHHKSTVLPMHWTLPIFGPVPMSITRFLSLISPSSPSNPSQEDLFSSDLPSSILSKTFGEIGSVASPLQPLPSSQKKSMMVLLSGNDEYCPPSVDKLDLLTRWKTAAAEKKGGELHSQSQVIENALHDLSGSSEEQGYARQVVFRKAVLSYLSDVLGDGAQTVVEQGVAEMKL